MMKRQAIDLIVTGLFCFFLGIVHAQAFDKEKLEAIKNGQIECPGCDLSNADLMGLNLSKANLMGANLEGTVLTRARLAGAKLKGAKLKAARLDQVDLTNVDLTGVNLAKAWCSDTTKLPSGAGWKCEGVVLKHK